MWATLLLMAIAVSLEPVRIGLTLLMLNRPRPIQQLLAFLCGGFLMGVTVGVVALLVLHATPVATENFTLPKVQIGIGVLALVAAVLVAANVGVRRPVPPPDQEVAPAAPISAEPGALLVASPRLAVWSRLRAMMQGSSLWVAGISGLGIALPSVDYLAALAIIHVSGVEPAVQLGALIAFNVVAFALVEIPLLCFLIAPDRTRAAMTRLHAWIRSRTRRDVACLLAAAGVFLVGIGLVGL